MICSCDLDILTSVERSKGQLLLSYTTRTEGPEICLCPEHRLLVKKLYMKRNLLVSLPDNYMKQFQQLNELYIPANKIEHLPESIGLLSCLRRLDANDNRIKYLPRTLTDIEHLQTLNLRNNLLQRLPTDIGKLTNLHSLDASCNEIYCLPPSVGNLINLQELMLSENHLVTIPTELCQLKMLQEVSLSKNNLLFLPIDLDTSASMWILNDNKMLCSLPVNARNARYRGCGQKQIPKTLLSAYGLKMIQLVYSDSRLVSCVVPSSTLCIPGDDVPSLMEVTFRKIHAIKNHLDISLLPSFLSSRIDVPFGCCFHCKKKMFWESISSLHSYSFINSMLETATSDVMSFTIHFCSKRCYVMNTK